MQGRVHLYEGYDANEVVFGVRLMLGMTHRQSFLIKASRVVWRDLSASTREQSRDVLKFLES